MKKNNGVLHNALILFAAMSITKVIGALLKIPLGNILGGIGMGYFSTAYSVLQPVYALTVSAFPTVLTRLIAQSVAAGRIRSIRKIKRTSLRLALFVGFFGTVMILVLTTPFSLYIADSPKSIPAMLIIAPSLMFSCVAAVYKGYYEGLSNMIPTAMSAIVESSFKALLGVSFSYIVLEYTGSLPYAAAAAVLGITLSELLGAMFLFFYSRIKKDGISESDLKYSASPESTALILKKIFRESLPITLAALVGNLNSFIDLLTITNGINRSVSLNTAYYLEKFTYGISGGIDIADIGNFIYGSYTGIVFSLFGLIPSMTAMLSKSALPSIAAAWEENDTVSLQKNLRILFKGTLVIGMPLCFGMAAMCEPILNLLYASKPAEVSVCIQPLFILSLGGISLALAGAMFNVFLAIGRADLQVKLLLIGAAIKLAGNLTLIAIPQLNISGAAISTLSCFVAISVLGLAILRRIVGFRLHIVGDLLKAGVSAGLCGVSAYFGYNVLFVNLGEIFRIGAAVAAGGLVYAIVVFITEKELTDKLLKHKPLKNS